MGFLSILSFAHSLVRERVRAGDIAVDATVGNGHDTLFLSRCVGASGLVYGFDVQPEALTRTRERLASEGVSESGVTLFLQSHAHIAEALPPEAIGRVAAVMFNLGYLPGGDHGVVTHMETTLTALNGALETLRVGGVVTVVVYPGHDGGLEEAAAVEAWASSLPQHRFQAMAYRFVNQRNHPPYVVAVEKRAEKKSTPILTSAVGD